MKSKIHYFLKVPFLETPLQCPGDIYEDLKKWTGKQSNKSKIPNWVGFISSCGVPHLSIRDVVSAVVGSYLVIDFPA